MIKWTALLSFLLLIPLSGCEPEPYTAEVGSTNGSTSGEHGVKKW